MSSPMKTDLELFFFFFFFHWSFVRLLAYHLYLLGPYGTISYVYF